MKPPRKFGSAISIPARPNGLRIILHVLMHRKRLMMHRWLSILGEVCLDDKGVTSDE